MCIQHTRESHWRQSAKRRRRRGHTCLGVCSVSTANVHPKNASCTFLKVLTKRRSDVASGGQSNIIFANKTKKIAGSFRNVLFCTTGPLFPVRS